MRRCRYLALLLSAWIPLNAEDAKAPLGEGLAHLQHTRYDQAIQALERAVQLDPALTLAQYDLGVCYFAQGRFADAQRAFHEALLLNPRHRFTAYYLARLDLMEGHLDAAITGFANLGDSPPLADESYYLGSAYFRKGQLPAAIRSLLKAIELRPEDSRAHFLLARVYQKAGAEAEAKEQFALSEKFRSADQEKARDILACDNALDSQDRERGIARCRELLDGADPVKLVSLGIALGKRQLHERAVEPFRKAALLDPEDFESHYNLGLTYFRMKNYTAAREPLETAVALRPEYFDAVALLGSTLFALGDDGNALGRLRHAHELRPADEKIRSLLLEELALTARHREAEGHSRQAAALLKEARTLQSEAARN
jgi:tetratricopeptide (TPR) repeat protein